MSALGQYAYDQEEFKCIVQLFSLAALDFFWRL